MQFVFERDDKAVSILNKEKRKRGTITPAVLHITSLSSLCSYEDSLRRSGISRSSVGRLSDDGPTDLWKRVNIFLYSARNVLFMAP